MLSNALAQEWLSRAAGQAQPRNMERKTTEADNPKERYAFEIWRTDVEWAQRRVSESAIVGSA
jgi:hypothetical protein